MFTPDALSNQLLTATADGFWRSGSPELQADYRQRYFAQIPTAGERGGAVAKALGAGLFPSGAAEPDTVRAAEACLARTDLAPALRRCLADELDDLRRAVAHRA
ncbi:hypothetical protein GCM10025734_60010 [Kitasatospora paranensis]